MFGADGKMLASYTPTVPWNNSQTQLTVTFTAAAERAYFGGELVAQGNNGFLTAAVQDRLGSVGKYYPYGEDRSAQPGNDQVRFATYTRDSATGNDYADQRYYSSVLGRFMTPDPYKASGGANLPLSWNRYSYVLGDPVNHKDRHGLDEDPGGCDPEAGDDCNPDDGICPAGEYFEDGTCVSDGDPGQPSSPPPPDNCHIELRSSEVVIAGVATGRNHTMLVGIDDTTGETLGVIDGQPLPGTMSTPTGDIPIPILTPDVTANGIYNNASASTPWVDSLSNSTICDQWDALVNYVANFPKALYGGLFSNSNSLTSYLWQWIGQKMVGPPPGPNSTPGWNGPIVWVY